MDPIGEEQPLPPAAVTLLFAGEKRRPPKHKGRPLSPEHRAALSRALKGKKHKPHATINKQIPDHYVVTPTEVARPA